MTKTLMFEADAISGMDDLREQLPPTVPALPFDEPLYAFDKKARDSNRFPARVMENDWISKVATGDVLIVDEFTGEPAKLEKHVPAAPEPPIELSPALQARLRVIADNITAGLTKTLAKVTPAPLQKRFKAAPSFGACTCEEDGRKCLACREKNVLRVVESGNGRTIFWEGGETYEPAL